MSANPEQPEPGSSSPATSPTTERLLERLRGGDGPVLEELFRRYLPRLRQWTRGRLPVTARDLFETDDLVQEVLMHSIEKVQSFQPDRPGALLSYWRQAIMNRIRDEVRRARRVGVRAEPGEEASDPSPSPLEVTVGRELAERYEQALARLSEEEREAIVGRVELNLDYDDLKELLLKPTAGAARMQVARALVKLAAAMRVS
ncbi:MAG: sigma-70 family RNA polymerase sigma factor [Planctomycetota bacterium]